MSAPRTEYTYRRKVIRAPSGAWRALIVSYEGAVRQVAIKKSRREAWDVLRSKAVGVQISNRGKELNEK